jgi:hypothetical protein
MKNSAYKQSGHKYLGKNFGRGGRSDSKITKAMKGVASPDLLAEVAREDARRRAVSAQGNSSCSDRGVARDPRRFLQN